MSDTSRNSTNAPLLDVKQSSKYLLDELGIKLASSTLDTLVSRPGPLGGPPYRKFGRRRLYHPDDLRAWAEERLGPKRTNSSEEDSNG